MKLLKMGTLFIVLCLIAGSTASQMTTQSIKINPKPCKAGGKEGTCMFVYECLASEGKHLGICVDKFMFGSCCEHDLKDNFVVPQTTSLPFNKRPVIKKKPLKKKTSHVSTIQKPNGITIVVRRPFVSTH